MAISTLVLESMGITVECWCNPLFYPIRLLYGLLHKKIEKSNLQKGGVKNLKRKCHKNKLNDSWKLAAFYNGSIWIIKAK